ncbi:MAG: hypothetical protein QOE46_769 [Acidobacteriota bacterium]|jgi:branched-subunit amino acid transport protein AzlD|nr:hypothetical protein [Acidobacteriota bacterium]
MIKDSLKALGASARDAFGNWRGLLLLSVLYAALLACVYLFFSTGVANTWQLVVSAATVFAAPVLFFALQAAAANFALPGSTFGAVARRTPRDFLKVLLLALPIAALAVLFIYLLGKLQAHLPKVDEAPHSFVPATGEAKPAPLLWQNALVSSLWLVLLGMLLPLVAAHLWLSTARAGLVATLKRVHRVVGRAFAPQSVLVYAIGLFVFGLTPYFVLYTRTSVSNGWAELMLFGLRLALAFVLTLWGWAITLGALARLTPPITEAPAAPADTAPAPPPPQEVTAVEPQLQA